MNKRETIIISGSKGFLGTHVMRAFKTREINVVGPSSKEYDLTRKDATFKMFESYRPRIFVHMAAICGGIGANKARPADYISMNSEMAINVFEAARHFETEYVYTLGSVCSYPKFCPPPFKEEDIWNGYPEETNAPYGTAKRLMLVMQEAYKKQYGIKGGHLIPVNMFGPYDNFDLETSHVIPALIKKCETARVNNLPFVEVWGTGEATREFLYAPDCAEMLVDVVEKILDIDGPVNFGRGEDISILNLAQLIKSLTGFEGELRFSGDVAINGQPKRLLDVSKAKSLGLEAKTDLVTGLKNTIQWYRKN